MESSGAIPGIFALRSFVWKPEEPTRSGSISPRSATRCWETRPTEGEGGLRRSNRRLSGRGSRNFRARPCMPPPLGFTHPVAGGISGVFFSSSGGYGRSIGAIKKMGITSHLVEEKGVKFPETFYLWGVWNRENLLGQRVPARQQGNGFERLTKLEMIRKWK